MTRDVARDVPRDVMQSMTHGVDAGVPREDTRDMTRDVDADLVRDVAQDVKRGAAQDVKRDAAQDVKRGTAADLPRGTARQGALLPAPRSETADGTRHRPAAVPGPPLLGASSPTAGIPGHIVVGVGSVQRSLSAVLPVVSSTVGLVVDRSSHVVRVVLRATLGPVGVVLGRVVDVGLGDVVVPPSPRRPAPVPVPPGCVPAGVSDSPGRALPGVVATPVSSASVPARAVVLPVVASVSALEAVRGAVSAGRVVGWSGRVSAGAGAPVWPVTPPEQDAAGASDRSGPGPGAGSAVVRPSLTCSEQVFDAVPLVVGAGFPSVSARPG
ncbi:hypothetical protein [Micromonospora sp. WMMD964]|uniref:hypothetical protein n=1 Tax=Micromonospora sp. WMMD964 TaxID=3016091 RepID=UPI00249B3419|nr:hypothetical protein [Micromonospora sp. WMMD964]WFE99343.1 hypothetical protein O7616_20890 [Micromonospora sp. WMMD964]